MNLEKLMGTVDALGLQVADALRLELREVLMVEAERQVDAALDKVCGRLQASLQSRVNEMTGAMDVKVTVERKG